MIGFRVFRRDFFASDKADESHRLPTAGAPQREKGVKPEASSLSVGRKPWISSSCSAFRPREFCDGYYRFWGFRCSLGTPQGVWRLLTCYHDATTIWIHAMAGKPGMRSTC